MPCASLSVLGGPSGIDCDGVHSGWNSRGVSMAGMYDCVKECVSFIM